MSQPTGERPVTTERLTGHSSDLGQGLPSTSEVRELIARRAYDHYKERGEQSGDELSDWLNAEREVVAMLLAEPPEPAEIETPNGKHSRDRVATKRTGRANGAGTRASNWSKRKNTREGTRA
jgi:hypothetical protein